MKIAISAVGNDPDTSFDPRFGRCACFLIVDEATNAWNPHENPAASEGGSAGVQAAHELGRHGVEAVISGEFGPNAHDALSTAGIRMFRVPSGKSLTPRELFAQYQAGQLEEVHAPTGTGPGLGRRGRGGLGRGRGRR